MCRAGVEARARRLRLDDLTSFLARLAARYVDGSADGLAAVVDMLRTLRTQPADNLAAAATVLATAQPDLDALRMLLVVRTSDLPALHVLACLRQLPGGGVPPMPEWQPARVPIVAQRPLVGDGKVVPTRPGTRRPPPATHFCRAYSAGRYRNVGAGASARRRMDRLLRELYGAVPGALSAHPQTGAPALFRVGHDGLPRHGSLRCCAANSFLDSLDAYYTGYHVRAERVGRSPRRAFLHELARCNVRFARRLPR